MSEEMMGKKMMKTAGGPGEDERSIEELFSELDAIVGKLEGGDISLEDSFGCYETGMKLVKALNGKIDRVEKQILVLNETAGEDGGGNAM